MMINELAVALLGFAGSIVVAALSYLFTKKSQRDLDLRKWKVDIYNQYWAGFTMGTMPGATKEDTMEYARAHNKLLLVANSKTALSAMEIAQYAKRGRGQPESNEESSESINARLQQSMYEAMREDLFGRKANKNFPSVLSINNSQQPFNPDELHHIISNAINKGIEKGMQNKAQ